MQFTGEHGDGFGQLGAESLEHRSHKLGQGDSGRRRSGFLEVAVVNGSAQALLEAMPRPSGNGTVSEVSRRRSSATRRRPARSTPSGAAPASQATRATSHRAKIPSRTGPRGACSCAARMRSSAAAAAGRFIGSAP